MSLFAFSGVSGGSVGGTIRLLTPPVANSRPHVVAMAQDEALAQNLAGLFFRDIPAAVPPREGRVGRPGLMERAWIDAAPPVLAPVVGENAQEPTMESVGASWREGQTAPPAVLLNASSVLDGCVAVSATWTGLAAGSPSSCFDLRADGGPLASTHETRRLVDGEPGGTGTPSRIPAITGALLSARFPFVSPSGAIRSETTDDVLYLIDGGVYENTGLLSALSLWNAVEPVVAAHNRSQGDDGTVVEPWLLMLSSGYEQKPRGGSTSRPSEILAVVQAFLKRTSSGVAGEEALRQRAAAAFSGPLPGLGGVGGAGAVGSGGVGGAPRFVEVRPRADDPSVIAPLGWVLAPSTQAELTSEFGPRHARPGRPGAGRAVGRERRRGRDVTAARFWLSTGSWGVDALSVGSHTLVRVRWFRFGRLGVGGMADDGAAPTPGVSVLVGLVEELAVVAARVAACPVTDLVEPQASAVHAALRRVGDQVGVSAAKVLARVEADGRWATTRTGRGVRDFEEYVARESNGSRTGARRQTRLARTLEEEAVPGLAQAITTGGVSLEHADVITRLAPTTEARREALRSTDPRSNAAHLLGKASEVGVEEFTKEVKRWAARVDPTADETGHRDATERVTCTLAPRDDGVGMSAFMTVVDGACFETALTAVAGVPAADDQRSHAQRMGAALGDMARLILDHGLAAGSSGGFRPHLSVTVPFDTLVAHVEAATTASHTGGAGDGAGDVDAAGGRGAGTRGPGALPTIPAGFDPATLADGTPIPATVLARLACDSEITRVVFGPTSQVLDVGRAERLYTGALRRAVIARDRHCAYPGCERPPRHGEIHHIHHWAAGGTTSVENGILVCWHHHDAIHTRHLRIHRDHHTGRWEFHERDGTPIHGPGSARRPSASRARDASPPERGPDRPPPDERTHHSQTNGGDHDDGTLFDVA